MTGYSTFTCGTFRQGQPGIKKNITDVFDTLLFFELYFDEQLVLHNVTQTVLQTNISANILEKKNQE